MVGTADGRHYEGRLLDARESPGATLTEIPHLLSHDEWRKGVGSTLKQTPGLGDFWSWFERLGEQQWANMVAPC